MNAKTNKGHATGKTTSAIASLDGRLSDSRKPAVEIPSIKSFRDFLVNHARVRKTDGSYGSYTFDGRPVLSLIVDLIDKILGSETGKPLQDATLACAGGAQWGKSVLALNLAAYVTGVIFRNAGYYLPDDDLVQGIVDTKFRPDVVDQVGWFADMLQIGKTVNQSGKSVNRKGAFMVTNGERTGLGYIRGMGKIPTSFSMDVQIQDEKDDIPAKTAKFLRGRMTSSDLRFSLIIGTQRIHGSGQNKEFEEGTQHVCEMTCASCGHKHSPEEQWPGIVRVAMDGAPRRDDPQLSWEGDFKRSGSSDTVATFDHDAHYYFACVNCGADLARESIAPESFKPRRPERERERKFSVRVSQLVTPAIEMVQIVADWCQNAVRDPDAMIAFCCDRLAMPKSTAQQLSPSILDRARSQEKFQLSLAPRPGVARYAGLDTGDRCWFKAREVESPLVKKTVWLEQMSSERVRARVPQLFSTLNLSALFVDAGPLRDLARDLCFILNGLVDFPFPKTAEPEKAYINFGNGLVWDGPNKRWLGLKCAAVEFTVKDAKGVVHKLGVTQDGKMYPIIACNRNETIQRVVNELLTADEGVIEVVDGKMRTAPVMRLPQKGAGSPAIVETFDQHILAGSKKIRAADGSAEDFVDGIENHLLLAGAYSCLAEQVGGGAKARAFAYRKVEIKHRRDESARRVMM